VKRMLYTIGLVWSKEFEQWVILIRDEKTGEILSFQQYEEWIKIIGGYEREEKTDAHNTN